MRGIFTTGSAYWARYLAERLNSNGYVASSVGLHPFQLCRIFSDPSRNVLAIGLGGDLTLKKGAIWAILAIWWLLRRRPGSITLYWIGGDVVTAKLGVSRSLRVLWTAMEVKHIAGAPWFADELADVELKVTSVLFPYNTDLAKSMRSEVVKERGRPSVLCYLLPSAWENLNGSRMLRLAALTPNSDWTVMGMLKRDVPANEVIPDNVNFIGWVNNPLDVLAANEILIRLASHDAYSGMVRDAQAMGKIVLYNMPVHGVVDTTGMIDETIAAILIGGVRQSSHGLSLPQFSEQIKLLADAVG